MTNAPRPVPCITGIAAGAVLCATAAITVVVLASAAVSLAGLADDTRKMLRFSFFAFKCRSQIAHRREITSGLA